MVDRFGGAVKTLTSGTAAKGKIMAIEAAIRLFAGPFGAIDDFPFGLSQAFFVRAT